MQKKNRDKKKVLMTAGHAATTAFSLFEEIKSTKENWEVLWVGTKKAVEGKDVTTLEHKIFSNLGIRSYFINSGRLQRKLSIYTIPSILKFPVGFFEALAILLREKPDIIVSFGGHVSFPVTLAGFLIGIPVVVHEQTTAAGLANKLEAVFAKKVAISRDSSREYFPKKKTVLTGNLVRKSITAIKPKLVIGKPPVIYITGGSRGSQMLNQAVDGCLESLLTDFAVIHQTGDLDFAHFIERKDSLAKNLSSRYEVGGSFNTKEIVAIFKKADIVISRAGANTVSEILVTRKPSVLIPIAWVQKNEQEKNARIAEAVGLSRIIREQDLTSDKLLNEVGYLRENWDSISKNSSREIENLDKNASKRMVSLIESILK